MKQDTQRAQKKMAKKLRVRTFCAKIETKAFSRSLKFLLPAILIDLFSTSIY